jgi:hypothetical protein
MSDESLRELFRELHDEPVAADSLARVRAGVYRGIAARRKRFFAFGVFAAAAMAFVVLFVLTPPRRGVTPLPAPPAPLTAPAILEQPREQEPVRPPTRSVARRKKKQPEKPVLIRIETDDPEVVILLVGN